MSPRDEDDITMKRKESERGDSVNGKEEKRKKVMIESLISERGDSDMSARASGTAN